MKSALFEVHGNPYYGSALGDLVAVAVLLFAGFVSFHWIWKRYFSRNHRG
jgi:hypothetical protein